jgi:hypothetical protein
MTAGRVAGLFLMIVSWLLVLGAPGATQVPVDARSLAGEWIGHWKSSTGSSDSVYLSVGSVEGVQVRGRVFIAVATPGEGYYNRDVPFSGVFDGTDLHLWIPPALWLTLKVVGEHMQGSIQGQQTFGTVELDRRR